MTDMTVVVDACVLYPAPVRDILLSLAHQGLYHARWTATIHDEWVRNLSQNRPDLNADSISRSSVQVVAPPSRAKALSSSARLLHE